MKHTKDPPETTGVRLIITHLMMFPLKSPEESGIISTSEFISTLDTVDITELQYSNKVLFKTFIAGLTSDCLIQQIEWKDMSVPS